MVRIFVGPKKCPQTGQSKVFWQVAEMCGKDDVVITIGAEGNRAAKVGAFIKGIWTLARRVRASKRSVVYFCGSRSLLGLSKDYLIVLLAKSSSAAVVNHLHGSDFLEFSRRDPITSWLVRKTYGMVDCSIVLDPCMREQFADFSRMRVEVVENSVDQEFRDHVRDGVGKAMDPRLPIRVLFFGNIIEEKGLLDLVEGVETAVGQGARAELLIVGQEIRDPFDRLLKHRFGGDYCLPSFIQFRGPLFGKEKAEVFRSADIVALPSYYVSEAVPISVLEAMVSGCAVLLSKWRYLPTVFAESGAVFVEPQSPLEIAEKIRVLDRNRTALQQLSTKNVAFTELRYTEATFRSEMDRVLAEMEER